MSDPVRTYNVGRSIASLAIWICWGVAGFASIGMALQGTLILIPIAIAVGLVNHGLWQIVLALFDIADNTRTASEHAELAAALLKQQVRQSHPAEPRV